MKDPFEALVVERGGDEFAALSRATAAAVDACRWRCGAATARFHGFDLDDRPLLSGLPGLPDEIVPARTTVPLLRAQIGATVVVLFENGDVRRPIVVGVLQERPVRSQRRRVRQPARSRAGRRRSPGAVGGARDRAALRRRQHHAHARRQGLIKGTYVLSRSSGYNKIKGAAVDIN